MSAAQQMSSPDVHVRAISAFEAALGAPDLGSAINETRLALADLADVDELRRVATCLAVVSVRQMRPLRSRAEMRRWLEWFRLEVAWQASMNGES